MSDGLCDVGSVSVMHSFRGQVDNLKGLVNIILGGFPLYAFSWSWMQQYMSIIDKAFMSVIVLGIAILSGYSYFAYCVSKEIRTSIAQVNRIS